MFDKWPFGKESKIGKELMFRVCSDHRLCHDLTNDLCDLNAVRMEIPNAIPIDIEIEFSADYKFELPKYVPPF